MLTDAALTKTQKNLVFRSVKRFKFDPSDFQWNEVISEEGYGVIFTVSSLVHLPTQYYFTFGGYELEWSPGRKTKVERESHNHNWSKKSSRFEEWLRDLKDQVDQPDLWAIALQEKTLADLSNSPDPANLPLTHKHQHYSVP